MLPHRRRLQRINRYGHARYLTCSCYRRLPLFHNDRIKDAFVEHLDFVRRRVSFELYAWVIMPEHFHLLILPHHPTTVTGLLRQLKSPFARRVIERWRILDTRILFRLKGPQGQARFWQPGGGYDRNIVTDRELEEKIHYIHANPVRRGLVERPEDWKWSSAGSYAGPSAARLQVDRVIIGQ